MNKRLIFFLALQVLLLNLLAQNSVQQIWDEVDSLEKGASENDKDGPVNPWTYSTSLGTSFGYSKHTGSFMNMYLAPQLQYAATNRLAFHAGIIASQMMPVAGAYNSELPTSYTSSFSSLSAFVAASYRLTDDLIVFGSGMKSMLNSGMPGFNSNLAFDDISFGAAYSIGNFTIGASFHTGPFRRFNRSPFNTGPGFYPSPFY